MQPQMRRRWKQPKVAAASAGILVAVVLLVLVAVRSSSATPENVFRETVAALESQDAALLCSLADPQEVKRLGITPAVADALLSETLWKDGPRRLAGAAAIGPLPRDRWQWATRWGKDDATARPAYVYAIQPGPKQPPMLNLSMTIRSTYIWKAKGNVLLGRREFIERARRAGLRGVREPGGRFVSVDGIPLQPART